MIAFIGECELKTRDELPEHVLTSGMVSYIKRKQHEILSEDEVQSIVAQTVRAKWLNAWQKKGRVKVRYFTAVASSHNAAG